MMSQLIYHRTSTISPLEKTNKHEIKDRIFLLPLKDDDAQQELLQIDNLFEDYH